MQARFYSLLRLLDAEPHHRRRHGAIYDCSNLATNSILARGRVNICLPQPLVVDIYEYHRMRLQSHHSFWLETKRVCWSILADDTSGRPIADGVAGSVA